MVTGGGGHAVTCGKYKKGKKTPFTHNKARLGQVKETLQYSFSYLPPFNATPCVLLPILRHPVYKYCSAGLTKILTRL